MLSGRHGFLSPIVWDDLPVSFTQASGSPGTRIEPVTLDMVKKHLRFGSTSEDLLIDTYISAARTYFEEQTGRQCVDAVYEWGADRPPVSRILQLPRPPLAGDVSITYDDANGDAQTFDPAKYTVLPSFLGDGSAVDPYCPPGRIELVAGAVWPATNGAQRSFRIRRTCGYGATSDAMPPLVQAMLYLLIAHFHRNRAEVSGGERWLVVLPMGVDVLIKAFKYSAILTREPLGLRDPLGGPCR